MPLAPGTLPARPKRSPKGTTRSLAEMRALGADVWAAIVMLVVVARTATGSSARAAARLRRRRMRRIEGDSLSFLPAELAVGLAGRRWSRARYGRNTARFAPAALASGGDWFPRSAHPGGTPTRQIAC